MNFYSFEFAGFFALVLGLYCVLSHRAQNFLLLLASYLFYASLGPPKFLALIIFSTTVDYVIGHRIEGALSPAARRRWLVLSLAMNLGILGYFKYCNFFIANALALLHTFGFDAQPLTLQIFLPYGISFYTFHEISYTVDVYRGERKACRDLATFASFIAFFPQLIAGPIGRASQQLPQFEHPRRMTWDGWCQGATLFLIGLFKKLAVADVLSGPVHHVFAQPALCTQSQLLFGVYGFALQIYADFSGYSDMARGLSKFLGFELIENFNQPYFARNITEFWRRWHISLSTWLRDYLYIPLGGNRFGAWHTYRNLFLTMFLGGLWHGAAWTFAIWGSLHGLYLAVHKLLLRGQKPLGAPQAGFGMTALKILLTFHLVAFSWIFFASSSFGSALLFLRGLCGLNALTAGTVSLGADAVSQALAAAVVLLLLIDLPQYLRSDHCVVLRWKLAARAAVFTLLPLWLIMDRGMRDVPFIYFQF